MEKKKLYKIRTWFYRIVTLMILIQIAYAIWEWFM